MKQYPETMWDLERLGAKRLTRDGWIELAGKRWVFRWHDHGWGAGPDLIAVWPEGKDVFCYEIKKEECRYVLLRQINKGSWEDLHNYGTLTEAKRTVTRHFPYHANTLVGSWYEFCVARRVKESGKSTTELLEDHDRVIDHFTRAERGEVAIPEGLSNRALEINLECGYHSLSDGEKWVRPGLIFAALEMPQMLGPASVAQ